MYNVLVQQFRDGTLRLSEALAEFIASSYSSLKFFFVADKKAKNWADRHRYSAVNELIGQKWAITIMDDLIDGHSLTGGRKMTFELIDNYLPI